MLAELLKHPRALVLSALMHLAVIALMVLNLTFADKPKHLKAGQLAKTVQAEMVDIKQLEQKEQQKKLEAQRKAEAEKKKKQQADKELADKKLADKKRADDRTCQIHKKAKQRQWNPPSKSAGHRRGTGDAVRGWVSRSAGTRPGSR